MPLLLVEDDDADDVGVEGSEGADGGTGSVVSSPSARAAVDDRAMGKSAADCQRKLRRDTEEKDEVSSVVSSLFWSNLHAHS